MSDPTPPPAPADQPKQRSALADRVAARRQSYKPGAPPPLGGEMDFATQMQPDAPPKPLPTTPAEAPRLRDLDAEIDKEIANAQKNAASS